MKAHFYPLIELCGFEYWDNDVVVVVVGGGPTHQQHQLWSVLE